MSRFHNIITDAEEVECYEFSGQSLLHLDYKAMCASNSGPDLMVTVIVVEVLLIVVILTKFTWDCIVYRRTGQLPWVARSGKSLLSPHVVLFKG